MKKVKYLALVFVLLLGLIGGAYAYWTDQVVVEGTVETGHMNVEWTVFMIRGDVEGDPWTPADAALVPEYVSAAAGIIDTPVNKVGQITISNLYPRGVLNERVAVEAHMKNMSSIPVKFDEAVLTLGNPDMADDAALVMLDLHMGTMMHADGTGWTSLTGYPTPITTTIAGLQSVLNSILADLVLVPGQYLTFGENTLYFYLEGPDAPQEATVSFTLELKWKQFNQ